MDRKGGDTCVGLESFCRRWGWGGGDGEVCISIIKQTTPTK